MQSFAKRSIPCAAAATLLLVSASAQELAVPAPAPLLQAFGLSAATAQSLPLPAFSGRPFQASVVLGRSTYTLQLVPNDVRATGYKLLVQDHSGIHEEPAGPSVTYEGTVQGEPGSLVSAALIDGQLTAMVRMGEQIWNVQPASDGWALLPRSVHIVYRDSDLLARPFGCREEHVTVQLEGGGGGAGVSAAGKIAELALECAQPYYAQNGSSTTNTQNAALARVNAVNVIYKRDVQISHTVTQTFVQTTTGPYTSTNPNTLLTQFQNYWNANRGSVLRDTAHMFTGFPVSGTIGIAYIGVICNQTYGYGISWYDNSSSVRTAVTAHELGHNWNAQHCSGSGCNIMCAFIGGCSGNITSFGTTEKNQILSFKNSRTCLSSPQ